MNRRYVFAVLGIVVLEGCGADPMPPERRQERDAARESSSLRDASPARDVANETEPDAEIDAADDDVFDAGGGGSYVDEAAPPSRPDVTSRDSNPPSSDVLLDPVVVVSCVASFTVTGVGWDPPEEGGAEAGPIEGGAISRSVRLVGNAPNIGDWTPTSGAVLTESSPGTWTGSATFRDQQIVEFKFVKLASGRQPEWETWTPFDSNRSLQIACSADGGGPSADASDAANRADAISPTDARSERDGSADAFVDGSGDALEATFFAMRPSMVPAVGRSYQGVFGVRPPDATK